MQYWNNIIFRGDDVVGYGIFRHYVVSSASFSPDGKTLLVSYYDEKNTAVKIYEIIQK